MTKFILLGAGQGKRLRPLTEHIPKCLVKIFEKSIIEYQLGVVRRSAISDIVVITGYCGDQIQIPNVRYYQNPFFATTNMVETLFCAEDEFDGKEDIVVAYGDIIYESSVLDKLLSSDADFSIIIDKNWQRYWESRFDNVLDDAQSLVIENGYISNIGQKATSLSQIQGQYIGLIKFSANATNIIKDFYHTSRKNSKKINVLNPEIPFENSYMTDLLSGLIAKGHKLRPIEISNGWLELDTLTDMKTYQDMYNTHTLNKFINLENL